MRKRVIRLERTKSPLANLPTGSSCFYSAIQFGFGAQASGAVNAVTPQNVRIHLFHVSMAGLEQNALAFLN